MKYHLMVVPAFVIAVLFSTAANAECKSIAYSRTTGDYGTASESSPCTSSSADSAVYRCGRNDCVVELTVDHECGSIARKKNDTKFIATAKADNTADAGNKAIAACGDGCELVTAACGD